jgi:hypothetical protein
LILVGRLPHVKPHAYDVVVDWIRSKHPDLGRHFVLGTLPCGLPQGIKLLVQWIQDPLDVTDPFSFLHALELQSACDEKGIPIVNRVEAHKNTAKTAALERLTAVGIKTPRVFQGIEGIRFPVILREDVGHAGEFQLLNSLEEAKEAPFEKFYRPVLSEYWDVQSPDGLYRKYRCVVAGDRVVSHHLQISDTWLTRGSNRIKDLQTREEEIAYISQPDPFASTMLEVARALELDYVGIDYGLDAEGNAVIWEANQFPHLHFSKVDLIYRNFAMERTIAAMIAFYLEKAGLEVPQKLVEMAGY